MHATLFRREVVLVDRGAVHARRNVVPVADVGGFHGDKVRGHTLGVYGLRGRLVTAFAIDTASVGFNEFQYYIVYLYVYINLFPTIISFQDFSNL